jgi:hypothetical protein
VQPRAGFANEALDEILRRHGARRVNAIAQINTHIVEVPSRADGQALMRELQQHPQIEFVEIDKRLPPAVRSSRPPATP